MTTRRTAVKFIGGAAAGVLFTPAPWRLIRDSALWSENWPGIPRPVRGPIQSKTTVCGLCPGGCPVRARCVGDQPIALAGVNGGLCPMGVIGHHLPFYPGRIQQGPVEEARAAAAKADPTKSVAVLDLRPGRTASALYRKAMSDRPNGLYLTPPQPSVMVNLAGARTVLSLGAPLLEGWLPPAEVFALRDRFRLVQVEPVLSRTAALADEWLTEADAATLARSLEGPVLVLDREMSPAVVALNRDLGGWEKTIRPRADQPGAAIASIPDGSIGLLYIDESYIGEYIPWPEIQPKLAPAAVTIAFTWSPEGYARQAHFVLPTPVFPEALDDLPNGRVITPLLQPPTGVVDPVQFITGASLADAIKDRPAPADIAGWLTPYTGTLDASAAALSTKLYQESNLLLAPHQVAVSPLSGLAENARVYLETARGRRLARVVHDPGLPPGKLGYLPTPDILDLCGPREEPKVVIA
jgi:hypothetical protein